MLGRGDRRAASMEAITKIHGLTLHGLIDAGKGRTDVQRQWGLLLKYTDRHCTDGLMLGRGDRHAASMVAITKMHGPTLHRWIDAAKGSH